MLALLRPTFLLRSLETRKEIFVISTDCGLWKMFPQKRMYPSNISRIYLFVPTQRWQWNVRNISDNPWVAYHTKCFPSLYEHQMCKQYKDIFKNYNLMYSLISADTIFKMNQSKFIHCTRADNSSTKVTLNNMIMILKVVFQNIAKFIRLA